MTATVPTADEFSALAARVAALEAKASAPPASPPQPPASPPSTVPSVQARSVYDLVETFGVNTFSSTDSGNVWGSWPSDYRPAQVIAALKWLTADATDYALRVREYHYAGREAIQKPWLRQVVAAIPRTPVSLAIGANGGAADVPSMLAMAADPTLGIYQLEGVNEPNNDFGSGSMPIADALAAQAALRAGARPPLVLAGPSIVAGMPGPGGWITGYVGSSMPALLQDMDVANGHYYPPHCPDLTGDGTSISEYVDGVSKALGGRPVALTEFHPTLYASSQVTDPAVAPYYLLLSLFRAAKLGTPLFWYALFDYAHAYACGLFPADATAPRPAAQALRSLCAVLGKGDRTTAPGSLPMALSGLGARDDWALYRVSAGTFALTLWRSAPSPGGASTPVTLTLGAPAARIDEYAPLSGTAAVQSATGAATLTVQLNASVRVVVVRT